MRVQFLSRGPIDQVSGGYLYNRKVLTYLEQQGVAVDYCPDPARLCDARGVVIADSLIVDDNLERLLALDKPALLMHGVPAAVNAEMDSLLRRARIVTTGEGSAETLRAAAGMHLDITVIEPGVSIQGTYHRRPAPTASRLLCLANYVPGKGQMRILDALAQLRHRDWTLRMFGNAKLCKGRMAAVISQVRDLGLDDRIEVSAAVPHEDVERLLVDADLLLQCSARESYSIAVAEAIACGLPVLATATGNWRRFRESGLVEVLDKRDRESLVVALERLLTDAAHYGSLRRNPDWQDRHWDDTGREFLAWLGAGA